MYFFLCFIFVKLAINGIYKYGDKRKNAIINAVTALQKNGNGSTTKHLCNKIGNEPMYIKRLNNVQELHNAGRR